MGNEFKLMTSTDETASVDIMKRRKVNKFAAKNRDKVVVLEMMNNLVMIK